MPHAAATAPLMVVAAASPFCTLASASVTPVCNPLKPTPSISPLISTVSSLNSGAPRKINDFLAKLTILLVQNRISPRRASVLAYLNSLLLRTLREIDYENNPPSEEDLPPQIIVDTPRPIRDGYPLNNPSPS